MTSINSSIPISTELASWLASFEPHSWLKNGHLMTIAGNYFPRPALDLPTEAEAVEVDASDASRVLCHCHWQPKPVRPARLTVVLVHGLEGSTDSGYMHGLAARAYAAGMNVVRMNMRSCGDSETLSPTLYHAGLSSDVAAVVRCFTVRFGLKRVALVGYSMGGNMVLKMAGEWGVQPPLAAVATVCPAIDLAAGSDALHEGINRFYEQHFLRRLMRHVQRKAALFPGIYQAEDLGHVRSIREFDQKVVARYCGFSSAEDYYNRSASARVVDRIAVPTLILCAQDDPFIRLLPKTRARILANSHIAFVESRHGGHCAFLGREAGEEIHWAEAAVIRFLEAVTAGDAYSAATLSACAASQLQY